MASSDFSPGFRRTSLLQFIPAVTVDVGHRPVGRPCFIACFHNIPVPHTPEGSSQLLSVLPLPWPSVSISNSAPSCSPCGANISTLQDSLDVTGCCFAPLPQRVTSLQHIRLPRCTGCLLRGPLAVTTTGLTPVSRSMTSQGTRLLC